MTATAATVRNRVTVQAPPERAFEVFTTGMTRWWPREGHQLSDLPLDAVVIEPRAGGRWFERDAGGRELDWGRVTAWEPPGRVLLAWHLNAEWDFDPDPALATEVEVIFTAQAAGGTLVELEHRGFEVHGARADDMRDAIAGDGGWSGLLDLFAGAAR